MNFNPLENPICLEMPIWLEETAWAGHLPFAMFLISALRPRIFVELGVDRGVSYCTFCQAVKSVGTGTQCFGIDTWQGDEHAGERSEEVQTKLREHHDPLYSGFSKLVRSTFDEALASFADGTIDLLHIDGFHTYDAVRHDHETWLSKMSDMGIVIFHDTTVRERDFGVWKYWSEITKGRPNFEFLHSHGLGVLSVGKTIPDPLKFLFEADPQDQQLIRNFFETLGDRFDSVVRYRIQNERIGELESYAAIVKDSKLLTSYHRARRRLGRLYRRTRDGQ
ncbi:MAG: class I SAM-dependent methyltransferase [Blastocatellia bacterium]|nr:class I SAM-dependent methyltransferase [Blastocatellia bacterium]